MIIMICSNNNCYFYTFSNRLHISYISILYADYYNCIIFITVDIIIIFWQC